MSDQKRSKRGLGRGLSALMGDMEPSGNVDLERTSVAIELVSANPSQPRQRFSEESLQELAGSIKSRGILQPLIVRAHPSDEGRFQIVAGERRWRAAQIAQLHEVPVIIRDFSDAEVLEVALIENIQRADLNAIEEAASFKQLMDEFGHTQEQMAELLNKSRSHIANILRLLNLPVQVQEFVKSGQISAGHARALVNCPNALQIARKIVDNGLSVRETENLVRKQSEQSPSNGRNGNRIPEKDADTRALEADLTAQLRMRVEIKHSGLDGGQLVVTYKNLDQLDRLCQVLGGN